MNVLLALCMYVYYLNTWYYKRAKGSIRSSKAEVTDNVSHCVAAEN